MGNFEADFNCIAKALRDSCQKSLIHRINPPRLGEKISGTGKCLTSARAADSTLHVIS